MLPFTNNKTMWSIFSSPLPYSYIPENSKAELLCMSAGFLTRGQVWQLNLQEFKEIFSRELNTLLFRSLSWISIQMWVNSSHLSQACAPWRMSSLLPVMLVCLHPSLSILNSNAFYKSSCCLKYDRFQKRKKSIPMFISVNILCTWLPNLWETWE